MMHRSKFYRIAKSRAMLFRGWSEVNREHWVKPRRSPGIPKSIHSRASAFPQARIVV